MVFMIILSLIILLLVWLQEKGFKRNTRNSSNKVVEDPSLQEITEGGKKTCILFVYMMKCPTYIDGGDDDEPLLWEICS